MKTKILFVCILLACLQAVTLGQKTKVSVQKGKVRAQTQSSTVTVDAGQKAVLTQSSEPFVTVDDPLVDDIMKIYKWVEAEKLAQREKIDTSSIQILRYEDEHLCTLAYFAELNNTHAKPSKKFRIEGVSVLDEPKFYDLNGNLLQFELDKRNPYRGSYTLYYPEPIEPGHNFKYICVGKIAMNGINKQGPLRYLEAGWTPENCLNYFRFILPESAIFVDSCRPVTIMDSSDGRVAVTIRSYTGSLRDGRYRVAFLWPDEDGTSIEDLPARYRGFDDQQKKEIAQKSRYEIAKILTGSTYNDQSTPLHTLLSLASACLHEDKEALLAMVSVSIRGFVKKEGVLGSEEAESFLQAIAEMDFSTPNWPEKPENGFTHSVYAYRDGSLLSSATITMIFDEGKWYLKNIGPGSIEVYHSAWHKPASGRKVNSSSEIKLDWILSKTAQTYRVYLGTDQKDLPLLAEVSKPEEIQLPRLGKNATYYWRVDQIKADNNVVTGDVWQFIVGKRSKELVGWWNFDEGRGTIAKDSSGQNHADIHGATWTEGNVASALHFKGKDQDDYAAIPPLNLYTNTMTITAWIKTSGVQKNHGIVFSRDASTCAGLWLGQTNNDLRYNWNDIPDTWAWDSGLIVPNDKWTFTAMVVEPQKAIIYMNDGTGMKSSVKKQHHDIAKFDGITNIGKDPSWGSIKGAIDDVRIYNYALSKDEIAEVFEQGNIE